MLLNYSLNLFNSDCLYDFFNSIKQNYQFSDSRINIEIFFYFMQNYCSDSAKMLEIIDQLLTCLYKNHSCFYKEFSHYLEKNIKNFIYIKNTELFLFIYNIQNIILDYL